MANPDTARACDTHGSSPGTPQPRHQFRHQRVRHADMNLGRAAPSDHDNPTLFRSRHVFNRIQRHEPTGRRTRKQFTLDRQRLPYLPSGQQSADR